jgi:hypothetical protein
MLGPMTKFHLAQVNLARLLAPLNSPALADFVARLPDINALADSSPGFVWRLIDEDGADATSVRPDDTDDMLMVNLSVWESTEALWDYVYRTAHLEVLNRRRDWFQHMGEAYQALWWVPAGHQPTVAEAMERIEELRANGSRPRAFTFRDPYPAPVDQAA